MRGVAHARVGIADPQSGPATSRGVGGFFHYSLQWIHAEAGRIVGLSKSHYINRQADHDNDAPMLGSENRQAPSGPGASVSAYINRHESEANPELGHGVLITRGLPVTDGAGLARLLDARERKSDRTYRQYGGRMPRVGCHGILAFQWGLTEEAATDALVGHARMISDRLHVPIEGRIHVKEGRPDHAHLIIGTRVVERGCLGRKQRQLDAVSEKADGRGLAVDGRMLGSTLEMLRADWAERMRQASGDGEIDHRSYRRRSLPIYPVTHVPRSEIEYQKRRNSETWRTHRSEELTMRVSTGAATAVDHANHPEPSGTDIGSAREDGSALRRPEHARDPARSMHQVVDGASPPDGTQRKRDGDGLGAGDPPAHNGAVRPAATPISARLRPVIEVHKELQRAHRLTSDREEMLAAFAHVDVDALRRVSADGLGPEPEPSATGAVEDRPSDLLKLVYLWQEEDRRARAERRREKRAGVTLPVPDLTVARSATNDSARQQIPSSEQGRVDPPAAVSPTPGAALNRALDDLKPASGTAHNDRRFSAILAHIELSRRHRLTAEREGRLAEVAGLDVAELRNAIELERTKARPTNQSRSAVKPELWWRPVAQLWLAWVAEDRAARNERRPEGARPPGDEISAAISKPVPQAASPRPVGRNTADGPLRRTAGLRPQRPQEKSSRPKPALSAPNLVLKPDVTAGPGAVAGSEALAHALFDAHVDDIMARASDANRAPPSEGELLKSVAVRMRASGYDAHETAQTLRTRYTAGGQPDDIKIDRAIGRAFSDNFTAWLDARAGYRARATQISHRAEMAVYRSARSRALAQLKVDLDDVWRTRREGLDRVMERHRHDVAWIREVRWQNRRLRNRGVILSILAVVVELAVVNPLSRFESTLTALERRELNVAAEIATARLRRLRDEWRNACGVSTRPAKRDANQRSAEDGVTPEAPPTSAQITVEAAGVHTHPAVGASSSYPRSSQPLTPSGPANGDPVVTTHSETSPARPGRSGSGTPSGSSARVNERASETSPASRPLYPKAMEDVLAVRMPPTNADLQAASKSVSAWIKAISDSSPDVDARMAVLEKFMNDLKARVRKRQGRPPQEPKGNDEAVSQGHETTPAPTLSVALPSGTVEASQTTTTPVPHSIERLEATNSRLRNDEAEISLPASGSLDRRSSLPIQDAPTLSSASDEEVPTSERGDAAPSKAPALVSEAHDERSSDRDRLVVDYALVVAASGRWSRKTITLLTSLIEATDGDLWTMVRRRCREKYGKDSPGAINRADWEALHRDTWRSSKAIHFRGLLEAIRAIAAGLNGMAAQEYE